MLSTIRASQNDVNASFDTPLLVWGPYLRAAGLGADGVVGGVAGRSDGLEWECAELASDGTHPSAKGASRTAQMLFDWLYTDTNSQQWFLPAAATGTGDFAPRLPRLRVTPDPTSDVAWVQLPEVSERIEISVFDARGRLVDRYTANAAGRSVRIRFDGRATVSILCARGPPAVRSSAHLA